MTWWTGRAVGFDTETDGPEPTEARIITGAIVQICGTPKPLELEIMLQPERDIPAEATAIHGISTEHAREFGVLREVGVAGIVTTIAEVAGPDTPVVGHNVCYDLTLLNLEMRRTGIGRLGVARDDFGSIDQVRMYIGESCVSTFPVIDTLVLDKAVDRYRPGSRKLVDVAAHYGVPMAAGTAHGATADVIAALRIAITIANRCGWEHDDLMAAYRDRRTPADIAATFRNLGARSLADLHCAQVRWAREQAEGMRDHFIKKDKLQEAAGVSGEWPLRTLPDAAGAVETVDTTLA